MDLTALDALDRTALLLQVDYFNNALSKADISAGLLATSARVVATARELTSAPAQHAVVTLALHLSRCGIGLELEIDDTDLIVQQPPLHGATVRSALETHIATTTPWISLNKNTTPSLTFTIGASAPWLRDAVTLSGTGQSVRVGQQREIDPSPWARTGTYGPIAAGIAGAGYAIRHAIAAIAADHGLPPPRVLRRDNRPTVINLGPIPSRATSGHVVVVSAGAITHGALYALLRDPGLHASFEVFDDDITEASNLNRYLLLDEHDLGINKTTQLERRATSRCSIVGIPRRYTRSDRPAAPIMLVGADHIPSRWDAQSDQPAWLGIGATSHLFSDVTTHTPATPCAGCAHPEDELLDAPIPTISVVSAWAGLRLGLALVRHAATPTTTAWSGAGDRWWDFPLALNSERASNHLHVVPEARCPLRCQFARGLSVKRI